MYAKGREEIIRHLMNINALVPYRVGGYYGRHALDHNIIPNQLKPGFYKPNTYTYDNEALWEEVKGIYLNPRYAPLMATEFSHIPRTFIYVARQDVVRDDALLYQEQLRRAGVPCEFVLDNNGYHGSFWSTSNILIFKDINRFLHEN